MALLTLGRRRPRLREFDPARTVFNTLTSVRFALVIIGLVAVAALLGVVIPQEPPEAADFPQVRTGFLQQQHDRFGPAATWLERAGLFHLFHTAWFAALLAVLLAAVAVCSWSRFGPTWRQVHRPQLKVSERYFEQARHRAKGPPVDREQLVRVLRKRHYRVTVAEESETRVLLFADRFRWSMLGTFASHLSLVIFLVGGLITSRFSQNTRVLAAEGTSAAVFSPASADHMQLRLLDFHRTLDAQGRERELYSDVVITRQGEEIARGKVSINRPLTVDGFTFHQAAFADGGTELEVRQPDGRLLYGDVLPLTEQVSVPWLSVRDATGAVLFEGSAPPTLFAADGTGVSMVAMPGGETSLAVAARWSQAHGWTAAVSGPCEGVKEVAQGQDMPCGPLDIRLDEVTTAFAGRADQLPGSLSGSLVELLQSPDGADQLVIVSPSGQAERLAPGEQAELDGLSVHFGGRRMYSGFTVRRDPGEKFIWVATILLLGGLFATFYLPRRRLWVRLSRTESAAAGIAPAGSRYGQTLARLLAEAQRAP